MVHFPSRIPGVEDGDFVPKRITKPVQIGDTWVPHIPSKPQTDENLLHLIRYLLVTNTVQRRISTLKSAPLFPSSQEPKRSGTAESCNS